MTFVGNTIIVSIVEKKNKEFILHSFFFSSGPDEKHFTWIHIWESIAVLSIESIKNAEGGTM